MTQGKYSRDTYAKSVCYWCGQEFEYKVPKEVTSKKTLVSFRQVFCSVECENRHRQAVYAQQFEEKEKKRCS